MRFSTTALTAAFAVAAPLVATAFVPQATFTRSVAKNVAPSAVGAFALHGRGCACGYCSVASHPASCSCPSCSRANHSASCKCPSCNGSFSMLRMADVAEAESTEEIPAEVEAMDGVASEEEAHNAERPARGSGIHKHKKGGKPGTPLGDLEIGSTVEATVKATTNYGAFLDIGAQTDALLHVSRLSDDFVSNVEDIVKTGDKVSVRIVSVDQDKGQIAVTMRSEEAEAKAADQRQGGGGRRRQRPNRSAGDREAQQATMTALADSGYDEDKFVEGEVVSTLDFGAFVRFDTSQLGESLTGELDGLVHISALTAGRAESVDSIVKVGDKVQVRVKNVDAAGGKVSLSMISKEDEPQPRQRDEQSGRRGRQRWSEAEMGAKDWKESLDEFQKDQNSFTNTAVVVDRRK